MLSGSLQLSIIQQVNKRCKTMKYEDGIDANQTDQNRIIRTVRKYVVVLAKGRRFTECAHIVLVLGGCA